jgi:hypothetical protein
MNLCEKRMPLEAWFIRMNLSNLMILIDGLLKGILYVFLWSAELFGWKRLHSFLQKFVDAPRTGDDAPIA